MEFPGISDWSVERIVEQTVARAGIALLHLEENPGRDREGGEEGQRREDRRGTEEEGGRRRGT